MMDETAQLFNDAFNWKTTALSVPEPVAKQFIFHPETVLACLDFFEKQVDDGVAKDKESQLSLLFIEAFSSLRYKLDNQDKQAQTILIRVHELLKRMFQTMSMEKQLIISHALHDSKLPTPELPYDMSVDPNVLKKLPDISPQLPALLERMRHEGGLKTSFELYDSLIAHVQLQTEELQCALISELIATKNTAIQDVGVFMLLHPKKNIRQMVPLIWLHQLSAQAIKVSPVSLRRFIVIRNWLPVDEQAAVDEIIKIVRKSGVMPAPYPTSQITRLVASSVDGAGVQFLLFETKAKNKRMVAGFLVKEGIGIREPFVIQKAHKEQFFDMLEPHTLPSKTISTTYASKLVGHFLAVGQQNNHVPEAYFLEIAELFGAQSWQPQPIHLITEINRIKEQEKIDTSDPKLIEQTLKTSAAWLNQPGFTESWFETSERVNDVIIEAQQKHLKTKSKHSDDLSKVTTRFLMQGELLDKWTFIFVRMLLWHRSKSIKNNDWVCFLVIADLLLQGYAVDEIPLLEIITERSVAHAMRRHLHAEMRGV